MFIADFAIKQITFVKNKLKGGQKMSYKEVKEYIEAPNEEKLAMIDKKIKEKIADIQKLDARQEGLVLEISETHPGRFRISRDYTKETASNKKLKRLVRE